MSVCHFNKFSKVKPSPAPCTLLVSDSGLDVPMTLQYGQMTNSASAIQNMSLLQATQEVGTKKSTLIAFHVFSYQGNFQSGQKRNVFICIFIDKLAYVPRRHHVALLQTRAISRLFSNAEKVHCSAGVETAAKSDSRCFLPERIRFRDR
jgi:hypothetical protein